MYYIDDFEVYKLENGCSKSTCNAYLTDVYEFEDFLKTKSKIFEETEKSDVLEYLKILESNCKSVSTRNRRTASLKAFFDYLIYRNAINESPLKDIKTAKVAHKELIYLTENEILNLLSLPDNSDSGVRDKALLELLYASGIRATEACNLNIADLNLKIGFINVNNGKKSRMVPIGKPCQAALREYLMNSRKKLLGRKEDCQALFLSYLGERLTRQGIWKILKSYSEKTEISEKITPQSIRNTFAVHLIQNGADLKSLQDLLGHEDIMATKIYLSVTKNRIMDVYDKAFPRA